MTSWVLGMLQVVLALDPEGPRPMTVFSLASPQHGSQIEPGSTVLWIIDCEQVGSSSGLAGFAINLVQSGANPADLDLAPGLDAPLLLAGFSRPAGISNPVPGSPNLSAYGGTPVGSGGRHDLAQIGGMQNTLGVAGTIMGTDTAVESGIAIAGSVVVASGEFLAPAAPGVYCIEISGAHATALWAGQPTGTYWPVVPSDVAISQGLICFEVAPGCNPDYNGDGNADQEDVACLVNLIGGDPTCSAQDPDFNQDGNVDQDDVAALVNVIAGGPCP
jgi:hypothetical protein